MASVDYSAVQNANSTAASQVSMYRDSDWSSSYAGAAINTTYFAMRAVDVDAPTLTFRTWVVKGSPDTTGALYSGAKSGSNPLSNIQVAAQWTI